MAYTAFDATKPNFSDGRATQVNSIRANEVALRDAIVAGAFRGFNYSWSGGTALQPTYTYEKNGNIWIKKSWTWNADGTPATMVVAKSTDGGTNYVTVGTYTYTYDVDGNFDQGDWS